MKKITYGGLHFPTGIWFAFHLCFATIFPFKNSNNYMSHTPQAGIQSVMYLLVFVILTTLCTTLLLCTKLKYHCGTLSIYGLQ